MEHERILEQKVLKYLLDNPEYLEQTNANICTGQNQTVLVEMKRQKGLGITPTLTSIQTALLEIAEVNFVDEAVDSSTFAVCLDHLAPKAVNQIVQQITTKGMMGSELSPREVKQLTKDLHDLQKRPEVTFKNSIAFTDFDQHVLPTKPQLESGFDFLRDHNAEPKIGNLITFTAPTNGGKSLFKMALAGKMWQRGKNILYIGLEESTDEMVQRLGCALFGITASEYKTLTAEQIKRLYDGAEHQLNRDGFRLGHFEFAYMSAGTTTVESLMDELKEKEKALGLKFDALFIDYAGLLTISDKNLYKRYDEIISRIFERLKALALKNDIVVVTSNQTNRNGFAGDLSMQDMADSLGGARNADFVFGVWRDDDAINENPEFMRDITEDDLLGFFRLKVLKTRTSTLPNGYTTLFRVLKTQRLQEIGRRAPQTPDIPEDAFNWQNLVD